MEISIIWLAAFKQILAETEHTMKQIQTYFQLECKKFFQALPGIVGGILLIGALLTGLIFVCRMHMAEKHDSQRIDIGVVAQENEPYLDWMISLIENMDSLEFTCRFSKISETEAEDRLRSGELDAIFVIPENYVESLIKGSQNPLKIRFGNGDSTISGFLIRQIGDAASELMISTQAGIYSMKAFYWEHHLPNAGQDELELNLKYLDIIAKRAQMLTVEEVSQDMDLSGEAYYFIAGIVLFLLFWGLTCPGILHPENRALQEKLVANGIGAAAQTVVRYLAFALSFCVIYLFAAICFSAGMVLAGGTIPGTVPFRFIEWVWCFIKIIPVLLPACALILLSYEIVTDKAAGVLFLFFLILILGYLSGCFYPLSFLPRGIQSIAPFLPLRIMFEYVSGCVTGTWSPPAFAGMILYTFILLGICTTLKKFAWRRL